MRFLALAALASAVATLNLIRFLWGQPLFTDDGLLWNSVAFLAPILAWLLGHSTLTLNMVYISTIVRVTLMVTIGTCVLLLFQVGIWVESN